MCTVPASLLVGNGRHTPPAAHVSPPSQAGSQKVAPWNAHSPTRIFSSTKVGNGTSAIEPPALPYSGLLSTVKSPTALSSVQAASPPPSGVSPPASPPAAPPSWSLPPSSSPPQAAVTRASARSARRMGTTLLLSSRRVSSRPREAAHSAAPHQRAAGGVERGGARV